MTDPHRHAGPPAPTAVRTSGEATFAELAARAVAFSGRAERATHGFHTYPAGMNADCAAVLIRELPIPEGASNVHDPFCGGGTVLVEALLAGRPASGADLSPVAMLVSRTRTASPSRAGALRAASRRITKAALASGPMRVPDICVDWYEPHVVQELGRIRALIDEVEDNATRGLLEAVLSAIAIKTSYRESDTSNRRRPMHRAPGTTAVLFHKKARELGRMLDEMPADGQVRVRIGDARVTAPPNGTGLVLTSPPYPGVYDYLPMQQLRYAWLDLDPGRGVADEVGSRRAFRALGRREALHRWRQDTAEWIQTQVNGLAPGGFLGIVVGDGLVGDRPVDTLSPTIDAMREAGLDIVARASADRPDHARETIRTEHLVVGRRPLPHA